LAVVLKERVPTHIFLCVLAYHLLVAIEKTLRDGRESDRAPKQKGVPALGQHALGRFV
jgi:hypothetical protein